MRNYEVSLTLYLDASTRGANTCRECFADAKLAWHDPTHEEFNDHRRSWLLRPNPAYWSAPEPKVLVLGFSKGGDQKEMIDLQVRDRKKFRGHPVRFGQFGQVVNEA
jgi:hypothetical protein